MFKNKGFTLLEVVIAIGILILVGGVAVAASTRAINVQTFSKDRTRAQELARNQMERIKALRDTAYKDGNSQTEWSTGVDKCLYDNPPAGAWAIGFITIHPSSGSIGFYNCGPGSEGGTPDWSDSPKYSVKTKVEVVADNVNGGDNGRGVTEAGVGSHYSNGLNESKNMRLITVTVTWNEPYMGDQKIELMSYITNDQTGG